MASEVCAYINAFEFGTLIHNLEIKYESHFFCKC